MSGRYAASTEVAPERSRQEIERILKRYGATAFSYGWQGNHALLMFEAQGRRVRFDLVMPAPDDPAFRFTSQGRTRSANSQADAYEQAIRQRWRALALVIKAKLEAVELGLVELEDEFLANIVIPNGDTVGRWIRPQLAEVYRTGHMPPLLPGLGPADVRALGAGDGSAA